MTRTVTKRADELRPGDIIADRLDGDRAVRRVVQWTQDGTPGKIGLQIAFLEKPSHPVAAAPLIDAGVEYQVEAPTLTRAQEHADELAQRLEWLLGFVETYAREHMGPAAPEFNKVRDVLARVAPPNPPTLAEALEALSALAGLLAVHVGDWDEASMQPARNQAHEVVLRARAAGIIP